MRTRALIACLEAWGLRTSEARALNETDVDEHRGSLLVRHGKGDKRREAGMDQFGFEQRNAWLAHRGLLPPGPLFCVIDGTTRGRRWSDTSARAELRQLAADAGVRRRFAPHQRRHAHAVELDLLITHETNGIRFTELDRQRLRRMRYQGSEQPTPEEVTAA